MCISYAIHRIHLNVISMLGTFVSICIVGIPRIYLFVYIFLNYGYYYYIIFKRL